MLRVNHQINLPDDEIQITAIRAQGAGGQNVNKVSTAIHLRFDINASSLPEMVKRRLLCNNDSRITNDGVIVIKAQSTRSQIKNREQALLRLKAIIIQATLIQKARVATRPSKNSQKKRLDKKNKRGKCKSLRLKVTSFHD